MNILFWNMYKKQNIAVTQELLEENEIDVAIFAEYNENGIQRIVEKQADKYMRCDGYGGCPKITLLARKDYAISVIREDARFTIYACNDGRYSYIIVGVHLPDRIHNSVLTRAECIRRLREMLEKAELQERHYSCFP